jgi:hypothetical protein
MSLTQEAMLTQEDISYGPTLKSDIQRMDETQLRDYIAANLFGQYFDAYASISFLPDTASLNLEYTFGSTLAAVYTNRETNSDTRSILGKIIAEYLEDFAEGKDVLSRHGHTSENPWLSVQGKPISETDLDYNRANIFYGIVNTVTKILSFEGKKEVNPDHLQFLIPLKKISANPKYEAWLDSVGMGIIKPYL